MNPRAFLRASPLPAHEARRLLVAAGGDPLGEAVAPEVEARFRRLEGDRLAGAPLQYLEGSAPFGPLELLVDERVLIPRPETEQLWELAAELVADPRVIVDLCTGSGALALGMAVRFPAARVLATELSVPALVVARLNAARLGAAVELLAGDLFQPLPPELRGAVDLVVANPPYVAEIEWDTLPPDVRREPRMALVAGPSGTEVIDRIAAEAAGWLSAGGVVACEIGETQGDHVRRAFARSFEGVEVRRDLAGRTRFVVARRPISLPPSQPALG